MTRSLAQPTVSQCRQVLLVEREPEDAALIHDIFQGTGLAVHLQVVTDGTSALAHLDCMQDFPQARRPDLIILDLGIPQSAGFEVLRRVKGDARLLSIPVVILTHSAEHAVVWRSYHLHANAYMVKPDTTEEFQMALRHLAQFFLRDALLPPHGVVTR